MPTLRHPPAVASLRRYAFALAPLSAAVLWGGMYVVSKWGFGSIPPVTLGFFRVLLGAAALLALVRLAGHPLPARPDWSRFVALGGWVTASIVTQFVGTDLTTAGQGSLLTVATPVFTVLLGVTVLEESLSRRKLAGLALATAGTVLAVAGASAGPLLAGVDPVGILALLGASATWAAYTVWGTPLVRRYSALETATYATVAATPMLGVLAAGELAVTGRSLGALPTDAAVVAAILYLGLASTALAWYLWYKGLEYVDAGTVAVYFFAQPVVGIALGAAVLGEAVEPLFLAGGVVMAAGVLVVSRER